MTALIALLGQTQVPVDRLPTPDFNVTGIGPELSVATAAVVIVMMMALAHRWPRLRSMTLPVAFIGLAAGGVFLINGWSDVTTFGSFQTLKGFVAVDGFALFLKFLVLAATFVGLLIADGYLRRERLDTPAYHSLILLSATGMLMMASANDLIVVFLALEILSIALYVLAAFHREHAESQEAGIKYFVLGAFSSAVFLYGVAFVYGGTGTTSLTGIAQYLAHTSLVDNAAILVGIVLLIVGFGFKIAAVPFHMWTPDVYQGAPTPVTGFMAAGAKVAGFAALLRVLETGLHSYRLDWAPVIWILAALTMVVGSLLAIVQTNVKRMMAYSSISHAGFILIGVQAATSRGASAALSYLFAYTFIVLGTFAVIALVSRRGDVGHELADYRGLARRKPVLASLLTLFMLGQAGIPLTSGFIAKLAVFQAAIDARQYALVILGVLVSVAAAFVYLRLLVASYMQDDEDAEGEGGTGGVAVATVTGIRIDLAASVGLLVTAGFTLWMGFAPNVFLHFANRATLLF